MTYNGHPEDRGLPPVPRPKKPAKPKRPKTPRQLADEAFLERFNREANERQARRMEEQRAKAAE